GVIDSAEISTFMCATPREHTKKERAAAGRIEYGCGPTERPCKCTGRIGYRRRRSLVTAEILRMAAPRPCRDGCGGALPHCAGGVADLLSARRQCRGEGQLHFHLLPPSLQRSPLSQCAGKFPHTGLIHGAVQRDHWPAARLGGGAHQCPRQAFD